MTSSRTRLASSRPTTSSIETVFAATIVASTSLIKFAQPAFSGSSEKASFPATCVLPDLPPRGDVPLLPAPPAA